MALKYIKDKPRLLDIGCHQGELLLKAREKISSGTGIDPHCKTSELAPGLTLINGTFPDALPAGEQVDCITALAVLEHIPSQMQPAFFACCYRALTSNGQLILTVPDARVDKIIGILQRLRLVEGMSLEEHFGFDAGLTSALAIGAGFTQMHHQRFQAGLNNLFVFVKR